MRLFEIYLTKSKVTAEDWKRLNITLLQAIGMFKSYTLKVRIQSNVVRYFIEINKDIGSISTNLEGFVFRPVNNNDTDIVTTPNVTSSERMVRLTAGGSLLDLRERYQVQKAKELNAVDIRVRSINSAKQISKVSLFFKSVLSEYSLSTKKIFLFPAHLLEIDFDSNTRYIKKTISKYLKIEKTLQLLNSERNNSLFSVDTFPYHPQPHYLHLNAFDFDKHSLIIGQSGSGKSKLIELLIDRINKLDITDSYRIIVIDPHAAIAPNLKHVPNSKFIDFKGDTSDLFPTTNDATAATELSTTLFKSIMADQFNPMVERVLRYSLFLLFSAQSMDFSHLKHLLTNIEWRKQVLDIMESRVPDNIIKFFHTDFNDLRAKHYNEAVLPIISMIDEMEIQPGMNQPANVSLAQTIQNNFLTTFSLNKVSMGDKVVKTIAGLLIQNIFILAQARLFNHKLILIVDEVSVVQNPTMAQILAEARKFGLSLILTQQYLTQVEKDLRDAIFSNNYNYYLFKLSEEDARLIEGNVQIDLPEEIIATEKEEKGLKESDIKVKMLSEELHSRECLIRPYAQGKFLPCIKAKTVDAPIYEQIPHEAEFSSSELKPLIPSVSRDTSFSLSSSELNYKTPIEPTYQYQRYVQQQAVPHSIPSNRHEKIEKDTAEGMVLRMSGGSLAANEILEHGKKEGTVSATDFLHKLHDDKTKPREGADK